MENISAAEQRVCQGLQSLLRDCKTGDSFDETIDHKELMSDFEWYLPEVLHEVHGNIDSFDGVFPRIFRKIGEREAEFVGLALFISDQTLTPMHFRLQLSPTFDRVTWIDLKLGERTRHGCRREPYASAKVHGVMLHVAERLDSIVWFYHVGFGERE